MVDMKKLRALASEKQEQLKTAGGDYPDWLDLDKDEEFVGKITSIRENTFDDSGKTHMYEVCSIDNEDELYTLRAHKSLVSKIEKQDPSVGSIIYIKSLGKVKSSKTKFSYNDYEVAVLTEDEYEEIAGASKSSKSKPKGKSTKDEDEEEEKPPAKKKSEPAEDEDEDEEEKPKAKKGKLDEADKKIFDFVKRALEFNDNEVDIDELVRLCKSKSIKFKDNKEAKAKFVELGFSVSDDGLVSQE